MKSLTRAIRFALEGMMFLDTHGRQVRIYQAYQNRGGHIKRASVMVMVNGITIECGEPDWAGMVEGAIENQCAAPMLDWLEDHGGVEGNSGVASPERDS